MTLKEKFVNRITDENTTPEDQAEVIAEYVKGISDRAMEQVRAEFAELGHITDNAVLASRGIPVLTAEEERFYNEVTKTSGFDEKLTWPETIIERVFDNLKKEHPLLNLVTFTPTVGRVQVIRSKRKGLAVFGPLNSDLKGPITAEFGADEYYQLALTAFIVIGNDTLELGARWIDRYIQLCLMEAIADVWEEKIIKGTGKNEPIGLLKDLKKDIQSGAYQDKDSAGTLTFADAATITKDMAEVAAKLSEYKVEKDDSDKNGEVRQRNVLGKIALIVNPADYWTILGKITTQNANGVFVTNLPFISPDHFISSEHVEKGKLIAFVKGEYDATQSQPQRVHKYNEVLAMQRATLYAIDMLGNGRPRDNYASQVYTLSLPS